MSRTRNLADLLGSNGNVKAGRLGNATSTVEDATDTNITSVADNDLLAYDSTSSKWINQSASEAGITSTINGATDTTITSVADNDLLAYDSTSSKWINQSASEAGIVTELADDTTPQLGGNLDTNGNSILFGSSKWSIELDTGDNDLLFKYNGTTVLKFASTGEITSAADIIADGTP